MSAVRRIVLFAAGATLAAMREAPSANAIGGDFTHSAGEPLPALAHRRSDDAWASGVGWDPAGRYFDAAASGAGGFSAFAQGALCDTGQHVHASGCIGGDASTVTGDPAIEPLAFFSAHG